MHEGERDDDVDDGSLRHLSLFSDLVDPLVCICRWYNKIDIMQISQ